MASNVHYNQADRVTVFIDGSNIYNRLRENSQLRQNHQQTTWTMKSSC